MYNTFECHFKPNQKSQSDMVDPVGKCRGVQESVRKSWHFKNVVYQKYQASTFEQIIRISNLKTMV